ncbi:hypothetical protein GCM10027569_51050 [Flindersiella endophytica]
MSWAYVAEKPGPHGQPGGAEARLGKPIGNRPGSPEFLATRLRMSMEVATEHDELVRISLGEPVHLVGNI